MIKSMAKAKIKQNIDMGSYYKLTAFLEREIFTKNALVFTKETAHVLHAPEEMYLLIIVATISGLEIVEEQI